MITLNDIDGMHVLRDDLLDGGTKSIFLESLLDLNAKCHVYASPVYGGFQIALGATCKRMGRQAVVFCAKRKDPHPNSLRAKEAGALVMQLSPGYLSQCQSRAKAYARDHGGQYLEFGANYPQAIEAIADRMRTITKLLKGEPDHIWCALGSGTLMKGIAAGTTKAMIHAVAVGAEFDDPPPPRVVVTKYHKTFAEPASIKPPFPCCLNYDAKAWEYAVKYRKPGKVLFWNVLG